MKRMRVDNVLKWKIKQWMTINLSYKIACINWTKLQKKLIKNFRLLNFSKMPIIKKIIIIKLTSKI